MSSVPRSYHSATVTPTTLWWVARYAFNPKVSTIPRKAISFPACGKAPGNDVIPSEVIKVGMNTAVLHHLHELLLQCWEEVAVPQEMHYANTITLIRTRETAGTVTPHRLVAILVSPSVSRRPTSVAKTSASPQASPLVTTLLEVVKDFTYLGFTISSNLSLDTQLNKRISKAAVALTRLEERV